MSLCITVIYVAIVAVIAIYAYFKLAYRHWKNKNIPYIEPSIPFGNFDSPLSPKQPIGFEIHGFYNEAKSRGWKHCGIYSLSTPTYVVMDIEILKRILTKDFHYFMDRGDYFNEKDDPIGANLFFIDGMKWKNLRTKLTPMFTTGKMKNMFPILLASADPLKRHIDEQLERGEAVDIKLALSKFGIDVIGSCAFGLECNSFEDFNSKFVQAGLLAFRGDALRNFRAIMGLSFPNVAKFLGVTLFEKSLNEFFVKMVGDTMNYRRENNVVRQDILQMLMGLMDNEEEYGKLGDGKPLTLNQAVGQCFVFFAAGFETSSSTMTFALYELSRHPEIQDRLREEISEVLKKYDGQITYEAIGEMKYMRQVIDEVLRLYPPLPFLTRLCLQDWKIPGTDAVLDKGTKVYISIRGIHRDPDYYEEPERFVPERFSDPENIQSHTYIPFGEGPRNCVGLRFGIMQTKVGLTTILKDYRVKISERTKEPLEYENTLVPQTKNLWFDLEKLH